MANRDIKRPNDDFTRVIREVDELVEETERIRSRVEESMRHRAFFPDRRRSPRYTDLPPKPPSSEPSKDSHAA